MPAQTNQTKQVQCESTKCCKGLYIGTSSVVTSYIYSQVRQFITLGPASSGATFYIHSSTPCEQTLICVQFSFKIWQMNPSLITFQIPSPSHPFSSSAALQLSPPPQASVAPESAALSLPASVWRPRAAELSPIFSLPLDGSVLSLLWFFREDRDV